MSIDRRVNKEDVVGIYNGMLLSHKKHEFKSVLVSRTNQEPVIHSEGSHKEITHIYGI